MNEEKNLTKTNINWYPGHMAKTKRQIMEDMKLIDVVIQVIDSRIPKSSQNPDLIKMIEGKKTIIALNKNDLSDSNQNKKWCEHFERIGIMPVLINCATGEGIKELKNSIKRLMSEEIKNYAEKGRIGKTIKCIIVGIPNAGKSSLINKLANKNSLEVGNKPGVTKQKKWIRIDDNIELLDTPGVLWPKFESNEIALNLAYTGAIKDEVLDKEEIAFCLVKHLVKNEIDSINSRYGLTHDKIKEIILNSYDENTGIYEIIMQIGRKRGALVSGGNIDSAKTSNIILEDFRSGKLGRITLEKI